MKVLFADSGDENGLHIHSQKQSYGGLPRPAILSKKRLWNRGFPVNFAKFLTTPFFVEHLRWLLLHSFNKKPVSKKQSTTAEKKTE